MNAAVFLDRDNTIIHNDGDLGDPEAVHLIQGAASAIASLRGLGYKIVVVSNQGGVARGKFTEEDVEAVHVRINELIQHATGAHIDRFYYCPYHPEGTVEAYRREHPWRKPAPGMLQEAARDLSIDLKQSWMIGDQLRDIEAGLAAGTRTIWLTHDAQEIPTFDERLPRLAAPGLDRLPEDGPRPHHTARRLIEAVRIVAQQRRPDVAEQMHARADAAVRKRYAARLTAEAGRVPARETPESAPPEAHEAAPEETPAPREEAPPPGRVQSPGAAPNAPGDSGPETGASPAPGEAPVTGAAAQAKRPFRPLVLPPREAPGEAAEARGAGPGAEKRAPGAAEVAKETVPEPEAGEPARAEAKRPAPAASSATLERLARQILQAVREGQAGRESNASLNLLAMVLQLFVAICLLGALVMGRSDVELFMRWIGVGVLVQLAAITTLLFRE